MQFRIQKGAFTYVIPHFHKVEDIRAFNDWRRQMTPTLYPDGVYHTNMDYIRHALTGAGCVEVQ